MRKPSLSHVLLNSGNSRDRALGRMLARGRVRLSPELSQALNLAERVIKDFSGAGAPMTGDAVHTNVPGGPEETPKQNPRQIAHKSRYTGPYV